MCRRGDANVCNHKLESFVMATAPPASYPGNALLCHCVERRKEGRSGEIHPRSGEPSPATLPPPLPPAASFVEKLDETAELHPELLSPRLPLGDQLTRLDLAQTIRLSSILLAGPATTNERLASHRSPRSFSLRNRGILNEDS